MSEQAQAAEGQGLRRGYVVGSENIITTVAAKLAVLQKHGV